MFARDSVFAKFQRHWINLDFILVTSIDIIKEINRVFHYPRMQKHFHPKEKTLKKFLKLIFRKAQITKDRYKTDRITADPTNNKFLACAMKGKADYIVSRDPHLRNLKHYQGIQIVDAGTFIEAVIKTKNR